MKTRALLIASQTAQPREESRARHWGCRAVLCTKLPTSRQTAALWHRTRVAQPFRELFYTGRVEDGLA